jgi:hypothetical protein
MSCEGYYLECQCNECINRETPSSAKDARIAELTAEVDRLRSLVKEAYEEGVSDTDAAEEGRWEESHARNALREGL